MSALLVSAGILAGLIAGHKFANWLQRTDTQPMRLYNLARPDHGETTTDPKQRRKGVRI